MGNEQLYDIATAPNKNNTSGKIASGLTAQQLYSQFFRAEFASSDLFEDSLLYRINTMHPQRGLALFIVEASSKFSAGYGRSHAKIGYAYITRNTGE